MEFLRSTHGDVSLALRVQPRSSRVGPLEVIGQELKWGVHAAAHDGAANEELIAQLSRLFRLSKREIEIVRGAKSRAKLVRLHGVQPERVVEIIAQHLGISDNAKGST